MQVDEEVGYRLSPLQARAIALHGLEATLAARVELAVVLPPGLSAADVQAVLQILVGRHELLRTGFARPEHLAEPLQVIGEVGFALEPSLAALRRPWDLGDTRALRGHLVGSTLTLALPQLAADRVTPALLFRELAAALRGEALPDPGPQYADVAEWLGARPVASPAPPFPAWRCVRGGARSTRLLEVDWSALEGWTADRGLELDDALFGIWGVVVARWAGAHEGSVEREVPGRDTPELARTLGPLAHPVECFFEVAPDVDLEAFLRRLAPSEVSLPAPGARPFGYRAEAHQLASGELRGTVDATALLDEGWSAALIRRDRALLLTLEAEPEAVAFMAAALEAALAAAPRASTVGALTAGRRKAEVARHEAVAPFADRSGLDALILATAARHPERPALESDERITSYGELVARARRWAAGLRAPELEPQAIVGVLTAAPDRALTFMLAAWLADLIPAPLDVEDPPLRRGALPAARCFDDADLDRLDAAPEPSSVAAACGFDGVAHDHPAAPSRARGVEEAAADHADSAPHRSSLPAALRFDEGELDPREAVRLGGSARGAYVLLTSGSRGAPQPGLVEPGAVRRARAAVAPLLDAPPGARFGALTRLSSDLAYTAVFSALARGGTAVVPSAARALDAAWLRSARPVDVLKITPSLWLALHGAGAGDALLPSRTLVFGGEPLRAEHVARVRAAAPALRVLNHYGPTEATIGAVAGLAEGDGEPRLGRALFGVEVALVASDGADAAPWEPAELYLGGPSLARGYVGDPERTAARFVERGGRRMYATGDLVWADARGELAFIGRSDRQVKVNGVRVEPGEAEAALLAVAGVRDAHVALLDGALVAFVVTEAETTRAALEEALAARLPPPARPSRIVVVGALPRTASGKVDPAALAALLPRRGPAAPPRTEVEARLLAIWKAVLEVEEVGVDDDFFDLGGHSLIATQIVNRVRDELVVELGLRDIYAAPTVAGLAARVAEAGVPAAPPPRAPRAR